MARTPKARALGAALRQARGDRNLLLRELATEINRDIGVLSRWETGDRTPKPEQVAQILTKLGVDGSRYDEIMTLAYGTNESQWVATTLPERRQQMAAYMDWERDSTRIVEVAPLLIPGLLQTPDFIRAIMMDARVPAEEIAARVDTRLARQDVITRSKPTEYLVLLGRCALRQNIGGRQVMIKQLRHLLAMATRPNIELRVVPDHCGWHPGLEGEFALIEARRASIVFVGNRRTVLMLHTDDDVAAYRQAIDKIAAVSLRPDLSGNSILDLINRMERSHEMAQSIAQ